MNIPPFSNSPGSRTRPVISYPCLWEYRVIGSDRERLTEIIISSCAPAEPAISVSNSSSGGRFCSLKATLEIASEEMRLAIFQRISSYPEVKLVI